MPFAHSWLHDAIAQWDNPGFHRTHELDYRAMKEPPFATPPPRDLLEFWVEFGFTRLFCTSKRRSSRPESLLEIHSSIWPLCEGGPLDASNHGMIGVCRGAPIVMDLRNGEVACAVCSIDAESWSTRECITRPFAEWLEETFQECVGALSPAERAHGMRPPTPFNENELAMLQARTQLSAIPLPARDGLPIYARVTNPTLHSFFGVTVCLHYETDLLEERSVRPVRWASPMSSTEAFIDDPFLSAGLVVRSLELAPQPKPWQRREYREFDLLGQAT